MRLLVHRLFHGPFPRGLLTDPDIFVCLAAFAPAFDPAVEPASQPFGRVGPGKTEHPGHGHQQEHDGQQGRAGGTEPANGQWAEQGAQHATGIAGQPGVPAVKAAPFENGTGHQQQRHAGPEQQALTTPSVPPAQGLRRVIDRAACQTMASQPASQRRQPASHTGQQQPPDRHTQQVIAQVGEPGPRLPSPVHDLAGPSARRGPRGILQGMRYQGYEPEQQTRRTKQEGKFVRKPLQPGGRAMGIVFVEGVQ